MIGCRRYIEPNKQSEVLAAVGAHSSSVAGDHMEEIRPLTDHPTRRAF